MSDLPLLANLKQTGRRLVNSKFPPIALFDDVADPAEFDALYRIQALTNPRLQTEVGDLSLVRRDEIPFGILGCSYATAPFTHVNPDGSRFSDGSFGVLYVADNIETALAEVGYHQKKYWEQIEGLHFERFVFRELSVTFNEGGFADAGILPYEHPIYQWDDYSVSQQLGRLLRRSERRGLRYHSVRRTGSVCWGTFTPAVVSRIVQTAHYEMIWSEGRMASVNRIRPSSP